MRQFFFTMKGPPQDLTNAETPTGLPSETPSTADTAEHSATVSAHKFEVDIDMRQQSAALSSCIEVPSAAAAAAAAAVSLSLSLKEDVDAQVGKDSTAERLPAKKEGKVSSVLQLLREVYSFYFSPVCL
jgi:hypothetical protein